MLISMWKVLQVVEGMIEAEIIKGKLESNEIEVRLQYESAGHIFGITMDGLGKVKILVPDNQLDEAREILAESSES